MPLAARPDNGSGAPAAAMEAGVCPGVSAGRKPARDAQGCSRRVGGHPNCGGQDSRGRISDQG